MLNASAMAAGFGQLGPEQLRAALENSLPRGVRPPRKSEPLKLDCGARLVRLYGTQWHDGSSTSSFR